MNYQLLDDYGDEMGYKLGDKVTVQTYHKKVEGLVQNFKTDGNGLSFVKVNGEWFDGDQAYK